MAENRGVEFIRKELQKTAVDYIETEYFGKTPELRERVDAELRKTGELFQEPYYEATPSYEVAENGIGGAQIPDDAKAFLLAMASAGRGVFPNPYSHQISALNSFWADRDVLVSTGTGSGKTECFMWPIVSRLSHEAATSPSSWKSRAVRVLILYPMNALVSDQLGRLRKMLGAALPSLIGFGTLVTKEGGAHSLVCTREEPRMLARGRISLATGNMLTR